MEGNVVAATEQIMKFLTILIVSGIICIKLSEKLRMPDTVLFILMGVILGPEMIGLVNLKDFPITNQFVLTFGAAYILYDGGREIQLKVLNKVKVSVFLLSTLGVILSAVIIGFFAQKILGINFIYALLLGSVIASTDPSVLIPLLRI